MKTTINFVLKCKRNHQTKIKSYEENNHFYSLVYSLNSLVANADVVVWQYK